MSGSAVLAQHLVDDITVWRTAGRTPSSCSSSSRTAFHTLSDTFRVGHSTESGADRRAFVDDTDSRTQLTRRRTTSRRTARTSGANATAFFFSFSTARTAEDVLQEAADLSQEAA
ncbi:unnamed protein product, partial [Amoebophrya sp. A25]|eukprot:GSA25T00024181001.1